MRHVPSCYSLLATTGYKGYYYKITSYNAHIASPHIIQSISSLRLITCYTIRVATNDNFSLSLTTSGSGGGESSYSCDFKMVINDFHDGK